MTFPTDIHIMQSRKPLLALSLTWCLLLLVPGGLYLSQHTMFPLIALNSQLSNGLYWLTSSGTAPYGVTTVLVLLLVCYRLLPTRHFISLLMAVSLSMLLSLSLNSQLKTYFNEPRPNAVLLAQKQALNLTQFYQLPTDARREAMATALDTLKPAQLDLRLSDNIVRHWQHEVGFSFPSGHTLFAVTLALVMSYFLLLAQQYLLPPLLCLWALGMGFSRMLLGMHWPQDVFAATALGGLISLVTICCINACAPKFIALVKPRKP